MTPKKPGAYRKWDSWAAQSSYMLSAPPYLRRVVRESLVAIGRGPNIFDCHNLDSNTIIARYQAVVLMARQGLSAYQIARGTGLNRRGVDRIIKAELPDSPWHIPNGKDVV